LESCRRLAPEETGGILVSYYTDALNCAVVTDASERPRLQERKDLVHMSYSRLARVVGWAMAQQETRYYLGEWHFHPGGSAEPNPTDTFNRVAYDWLDKTFAS